MRCRSHSRSIALLAVLISSIFAQTAVAQNPQSPFPTLHVDTRDVVVDVVVTGKDGKAVLGLTRQDFQMFEDGKPQTINYFEQHAGATAGAAPVQLPQSLPADTFTNIPAGPPNDSVNVLLLDGVNTTLADQLFVHKEVARYLATIPPGVRIAVFTLSMSDRLRIVQGFTEDTSSLRTAIAHEIANPELSAVGQNNPGGSNSSSAALGGFMGEVGPVEANYRAVTTLQGLQQIARYLAGVPGRKNLVWFTSYNPILISAAAEGNDSSTSPANPNGGSPYYEMSKRTVNMLANAQVSVYPIEASGVATDSVGNASTVPTDYQNNPIPPPGQTVYSDTLRRGAKGRNIIHLTMDQLAWDTGGKAAYNRNGLKEAMAEDIDNGARYYTIAYTPSNRSEKGKERKIEIKLTSAKHNLAYRRSYIEDNPREKKPAETTQAKDPLRSLMDRGMPDFTELRYQTHIAPTEPQPAAKAARAGDNSALKPPSMRYGVDFTLATDGLSLVAGPDGVRHGKIEVSLVPYSHDGKPLNWMVHFVGLVVRPDQYAMAQNSGIPFHLDFDVPPGDVYLRSGIYDTSSNKAGTLEIPLSAVALAAR